MTRFSLFFVALLAWGLLSFIWTINRSETLLYLAHLFITFTGFSVIYIIVSIDKEYYLNILLKTAIATGGVTAVWILSKFYTANDVLRTSALISNSKLNFSNINIASAYCATLLPIALYGVYQFKKGWKVLAFFSSISLFSAALIIGSRTALFSALAITICSTIYCFAQYLKSKSRQFAAYTLLPFITILIFGYLIATFPNSGGKFNSIENLYTSTNTVQTTAQNQDTNSTFTSTGVENFTALSVRSLLYRMAWEDFTENPILGVGLGNWKILNKDEHYKTRKTNDFVSPQHVHNDFLQILAEGGIVGGLAYFGLFIMLVIGLFTIVSQKKEVPFAFFVGLSLGAYILDALLNFPFSRASTQWHFALLAILVFSKQNNLITAVYKKQFILALLAISCLSVGTQYIKFKSSQGSKLIRADLIKNNALAGKKLSYSYNEVRALIPSFYDLSPDGRTHDYIYSFYALNEKKYDLALKHLDKAIHIAPHKYSAHMNKAIIFKSHTFNQDSAMHYAEIGIKKVPNIGNNYTVMLPLLKQQKDTLRFLAVAEQFLKYFPKSTSTRKDFALWHLNKHKDFDRAISILNEGIKTNPNDKQLLNLIHLIQSKRPVTKSKLPTHKLLGKAQILFNKKKYNAAIIKYKQLLLTTPKQPTALLQLGICYLETQKHKEALDLLTRAIKTNYFTNGKAYYYRGLTYKKLKQYKKAENDFAKSKKMRSK